ncbi:MAG TPA: outer membrane beta-barrel protein [Vicinamibacteria bacterium]
MLVADGEDRSAAHPAAARCRRRLEAAAAVAALLLAVPAAGQPAAGEDAQERPRPGLLRAGPVYLTPRLRLGTIGLDTNVFYTPTDRRTDFTASGGPGLEIVLPVRSSVQLSMDGGLDYVYFLETASQRRLAGDGKGRLDLVGARASLGTEAGWRRTFSRPSFEVDRRIVQDQRHARGDGRVDVGPHLQLRVEAGATRLDVPSGQDWGGADLRRALSRDTYLGRFTTAYRVTAKTSLLLEADHQADRFLLETARDADSNRLAGGFELRSTTRLSGRALAGVRSFRLRRADPRPRIEDTLEPYALVDLSYHFGPRTRIGAAYTRDLQYSAFTGAGGSPTVTMEAVRVRLEKGLVGALDLRLHGGLTRLRSEGLVTIAPADGEPVTAVRDDEAWEAGADLGYTFRRHLRVGVAASYVERRSTIEDFGIDGLLVGGTITFTP